MSNIPLTILSISASGTILILLLFTLKPLLRNKVTKTFSYYIWLLVLLRLILPFGYSFSLPDSINALSEKALSETVFQNPSDGSLSADKVQSGAASPDTDKVNPDNTAEGCKAYGTNQAKGESSSAEAVKSSFVLSEFLKNNILLIWLAGMIISICRYSVSYLTFVRRLRRSFTPPHCDDIDFFSAMRGDRKISLVCSSVINTPMLIGAFRPVIVIPQPGYCSNGMENELSNILQHELTHYRRHDILYKWFVVLVISLHWYNPFVYLAGREIGRACELSCDEAVIKNMLKHQRKSYGNTLLALASKKRLPAGVTAATLSEEKKHLKGRLISIMNYRKKSGLAVVLMVVLALFLTGCASIFTTFEPGKTTEPASSTDLQNEYADVTGTADKSPADNGESKSSTSLKYEMLYYDTAPNDKSTVKIQYPHFSGISAEVLNKLVIDKVSGFAKIDTQLFPGDTALTVTYKSAVTLQSSKIVSIIFWGSSSTNVSAHPTDNLFAMNIDLSTFKEITFKDLYKSDSGFEDTFFKKAYFPTDPVTSFDASSFDEMLKMQGPEYQTVSVFSNPEQIVCFLKADGIVISLPSVHATGCDHFEAQLKYADIQSFYQPTNNYWD